MKKSNKFWSLVLKFMCGNSTIKSQLFLSNSVTKMTSSFFGCCEASVMLSWELANKGDMLGFGNVCGQTGRRNNISNICFESSLYVCIDATMYGKDSSSPIPWQEEWVDQNGITDELTKSINGTNKRWDELYDKRSKSGAPFLGNREYFLSSINF